MDRVSIFLARVKSPFSTAALHPRLAALCNTASLLCSFTVYCSVTVDLS